MEVDTLHNVYNQNFIVLTTPKGLMTIQECKKAQTGGKPLFIIK